MSFILRAVRLLGMVIWVGGLIFFAFVEAPMAFGVMGTTRQFAQLIGASIHAIDHMGHTSGFVFIIASLLLWKFTAARKRKLLLIQIALVAVMIAATAYVETYILPAMEHDRESVGGDIASVPRNNQVRAHFDHLHELSEKVEGTTLFLGFGVILLMAAEESRAPVAVHA
jgi:hypothetical protein